MTPPVIFFSEANAYPTRYSYPKGTRTTDSRLRPVLSGTSDEVQEARKLVREGEKMTTTDYRQLATMAHHDSLAQASQERANLQMDEEELKKAKEMLREQEERLRMRKEEVERLRLENERKGAEVAKLKEMERAERQREQIEGHVQAEVMANFEAEQGKDDRLEKEKEAFENLEKLFGRKKAKQMWQARDKPGERMMKNVLKPAEKSIIEREMEEKARREREKEAEDRAELAEANMDQCSSPAVSLLTIDEETDTPKPLNDPQDWEKFGRGIARIPGLDISPIRKNKKRKHKKEHKSSKKNRHENSKDAKEREANECQSATQEVEKNCQLLALSTAGPSTESFGGKTKDADTQTQPLGPSMENERVNQETQTEQVIVLTFCPI